MYYPYLRARQFELISLRELAQERVLSGFIRPILEPVKDSVNNLNLANVVFKAIGIFPFLIVNPCCGEKAGDSEIFLEYISSIGSSSYIPAFHYTNNGEYIRRCVSKYDIKECMIIGYNNFVEDSYFKTLCEERFVTHIVLYEPHKYRSLDRFLKSIDKEYIRLDDVFEKQIKNADFLDIPAHKFTEEHIHYSLENYNGFSDFTVLPSEFSEGGSTPRAVAIHITYINREEDNQIWIRHFTSNSNDSIANVQGKFAEAVEKLQIFCLANSLSNSSIRELIEYFIEGKYPGLGTVKKLSIKNHINVVKDYLQEQ